jgi:molybdate transport system substrate-binding protein
MKRTVQLIIAAIVLSFFTIQAQAKEVNLSVAASLTDAFKEMFADFAKTHKDVQFVPNFGASGALAKQIDQGAPTDIFVSANQKWMQFLLDKKGIAADSAWVLAYNKLVFAGIDKGAALDMAKLPTLKQIAIGAPEAVPAGEYAKQAMEKAGIYAKLEAAKKFIIAKDVRQALMYADRGEVDGAFVYKTDALLAKDAKILFTVPDDMYAPIDYPAALTVKGAANAEAQAFFAYMKTEAAKAILKKYGFEPGK